MRLVGDIMAYTAQHMPKYNSISISGASRAVPCGVHSHTLGAIAPLVCPAQPSVEPFSGGTRVSRSVTGYNYELVITSSYLSLAFLIDGSVFTSPYAQTSLKVQ